MAKIALRSFKGTRDFTPSEMIPRETVIETIKGVFRLYGFSPMETPALEMLEVLSGKYGGEGEKLMYKLDYKNDRFSDRVALRYDLTVPLARVVASHPEWPMPFKRYQIQPVWRADQPQIRQGRFREFYQCDVDTIGAEEGLADAEIIALTVEMLQRLGFFEEDRRAIVLLSHRKLLEAVCRRSGLPESELLPFARALDKLDKIGEDGVRKELETIGMDENGFGRMQQVFAIRGTNAEILSALREMFDRDKAAKEGLDGIQDVLAYLKALDVPEGTVQVSPHLARGLDYYTGLVFESVLPDHPHIGSLTGGGRYDELIGLYSGRDVPATGTTIGLDRIFAAMEQLGMIATDAATVTHVLVTAYSDNEVGAALHAVREFRLAGVACELYPVTGKLKKSFSYADKLGIPFVAVIGPDEAADPENLQVTLRDLAESEQQTLSLPEAIDAVESLGI